MVVVDSVAFAQSLRRDLLPAERGHRVAAFPHAGLLRRESVTRVSTPVEYGFRRFWV